MDQTLLDYLAEKGVEYRVHTHKAVFTVDEAEEAGRDVPGLHTKNLFLRNKKGDQMFLVCMDAHKRLDIKNLQQVLGTNKLSFCSPERLKEELNLTPGSVSLFGMIYAKTCKLILQKDVWDAEIVGFHPNINTATLELDHTNLKKFVDSLDTDYRVLEF